MTESTFSLTLPFEPDHPAFAGHFPGYPIIPGVQLLDRAKRLIERRHDCAFGGLQMAKFFSPARPGDALQLEYRLMGETVGFEIRCGSRRIASGTFTI
ncbi:MAG: beta-hydroxyacyl-ACP dehydratase [Betaproteobacteria bacterium]|nr:beta-hydroxyacyl-ACP dehydratase [Betaproteobacteria bacterium]